MPTLGCGEKHYVTYRQTYAHLVTSPDILSMKDCFAGHFQYDFEISLDMSGESGELRVLCTLTTGASL